MGAAVRGWGPGLAWSSVSTLQGAQVLLEWGKGKMCFVVLSWWPEAGGFIFSKVGQFVHDLFPGLMPKY